MANDRAVTVHLSDGLKDDLDRLAVLDGRSTSDLMRSILESHVYGQSRKLNLLRQQDDEKHQPESE